MIEYVGVPIGTGGMACCSRYPAGKEITFRPVAEIREDVRVVVKEWASGTGPNVTLVGVDPFKHPELPTLVRSVTGCGVKRLGMETDGVALCSGDNAAGIISAGVRHIEVVILAGDAYSHDRLTKIEGSFDAAMAGMASLAEVAKGLGSRIIVCGRSRICRHNFEHTPGIVCAFAEAGASTVTLEVDRAVNRGRMRPLLEAAVETGITYGVWVSIEGLTEEELGEYSRNALSPAYTTPFEEWRSS